MNSTLKVESISEHITGGSQTNYVYIWYPIIFTDEHRV